MFVYAQILPTTTIGVVELLGAHAKKDKGHIDNDE
jgi:hypothetical protein